MEALSFCCRLAWVRAFPPQLSLSISLFSLCKAGTYCLGCGGEVGYSQIIRHFIVPRKDSDDKLVTSLNNFLYLK
jgi:hypothetical protein